MVGTPLGLLFSLAGLLFDKDKKPALVGLIAGGIIAVLFFALALC